MPKVSGKRQVTLPAHQCRQVGIEYHSFVANGHISIMSLKAGTAEP